jgi:trimethylamine:corrinoid methyltransferase-like protein
MERNGEDRSYERWEEVGGEEMERRKNARWRTMMKFLG